MRTSWKVADVVALRDETPTARTLRLRIPGLHGHLAGQHIDVKLTAPDGYSAQRSYSIASALPGDELEITVDELVDGEVSPYLVRGVSVGDQLEIRGPVGGWFVWRADDPSPVQLIAGGSGVVPLMSMIRAHELAGATTDFRLLYSARSREALFYRDELAALSASPHLRIDYVYTRVAPEGWHSPAGRLDAATLASLVHPIAADPGVFICGSTPFVETVADWLVADGYSPDRIKTERYGGVGERP
ncbi:ferredoxin reductase [Compostimonas suwonensis]|uniref:Ferredoxin-NADP reductase n=1 Tax=Compostimonas suwonensis TaxID=1048394 RepID=A0A2M9BU24_9MICO|nr:ferredoxin reductase [Compostimonas suwonensis]PJJ61445.1 ferredoxin-NADP reductase [Compostimonas suwonensis]